MAAPACCAAPSPCWEISIPLWAELVAQLRQDGFEPRTVRRLLQVPDLVHQPYLPIEETCEAARWINFWINHQPQDRRGPWVESLRNLGLLQKENSLVQALCTLLPYEELYLLADHPPHSRVYALARLAPRQPALHLHCGIGLMPLLHQGPCHDPDARQLAFAELNARLNDRPFASHYKPARHLTACLPFAKPQNPDLQAYLDLVEPGGSLTVACSLVEPLQLKDYAIEQFDYARASLSDYVNLPRLMRAFGEEAGQQAYEVRMEQLKHIESIHDTVLILHKIRGLHKRQVIPYPLPDPNPTQKWPEEPTSPTHEYNEENLRQLLDLPEVLFTPEQVPALRHRLRHNHSRLAQQARRWLLEPTKAMLFPCLGQLFFTDLMTQDQTDQIYWLGPDSLALARCVPRSPRQRSLDLCTGSGVQAILNASHSQQAWAVDINPRAVQRAKLNARFNRQRLNVVQGDLYAPVQGSFDLITANPPFVPTPDTDLQLFRPGGESGEEITAEIIRQLPQRLNPGGLLALVSQCPIIEGSDALERVHAWLGNAGGWGLLQLRFQKLSRAGLIASHTHDHSRWEESYRRMRIQGAHLAVTLVQRLPPGQTGYRELLDLEMPRSSISKAVAAYLESRGS